MALHNAKSLHQLSTYILRHLESKYMGIPKLKGINKKKHSILPTTCELQENGLYFTKFPINCTSSSRNV